KMKKTISIFILISFSYCCEKSNQSGIEIYQVNVPTPDYTLDSLPKCLYCFNPNKVEIYDKPIITEADIQYFDWQNQKIILTKKGKEKIMQLKIPLKGLPAVLTLNDKPI